MTRPSPGGIRIDSFEFRVSSFEFYVRSFVFQLSRHSCFNFREFRVKFQSRQLNHEQMGF